jgi:hypothetical protein
LCSPLPSTNLFSLLLQGSLWAHPQVLGFVDVSNLVSPVITRDEFKRTQARDAMYLLQKNL